MPSQQVNVKYTIKMEFIMFKEMICYIEYIFNDILSEKLFFLSITVIY